MSYSQLTREQRYQIYALKKGIWGHNTYSNLRRLSGGFILNAFPDKTSRCRTNRS